jgi:two-component system, sensor histidine kinase and response regulator
MTTKSTPPIHVDSVRPKSWKVLVIEDDARWRTLVELSLEAEGHVVLTAADGLAGLALASEKPDVILCDVEMPRLNGYAVLEALRQQPELRAIPFIFLTARSARSDQRKGMVLGADDYITKPFESRELVESIKGVLAKRETLSERLKHYTDEYHREMAAPWAHELLTPLNGILGIAAMIESEAGSIPPVDLRDLARSISQSARRQQSLARKLLQYFQLEQLREANWSDPAAAMEAGASIEDEVLGVAERLHRSSDLRLDCVPAAIRITPAWLRPAVGELVENGFKFSPPGTPVTCTGRIVDGLYRIEVTDRGAGMTPTEIESIAAFRQFDRARHEQQGLGLGLAIVQHVAALHHAPLTFEPGPDGIGLRVVLELRLAD